MHFADAGGEVRRGDDPADAPTGDRVGFGHRIDEHRAVAHVRQRDGGDVGGAIEENVFVDFVGDGEAIVLFAKRGDEFEFGAPKDLAGGVIGRVDDDGFGARVEGLAELVGVEGPGGGAQGDDAADGAAEQRVGVIVLVVRLEDDDFVAGISDGEQGGDHAFSGAAADGDFAFGIEFEAMPTAVFFGDGLAEVLDAPGDGVLVLVVVDGAAGGLFEVSGSGKVREALREVDGAVDVGEPRHFANNGFGEADGASGLEAWATIGDQTGAEGRLSRQNFHLMSLSFLGGGRHEMGPIGGG